MRLQLAWGTNFEFLGRTEYYVHGSAFYGGPLPDTTAPGWPRKSYSTYVVLGRHSTDPVGNQVAQVETVQSTTLTASIGTVVTTGPAGVNRTDAVTYVPAGWNHVYGAWALAAAGNQVEANFDVATGMLRNPLVIVTGWTAGTLPGAVRLNGTLLVPDVDYFASLRADAAELWITFDRALTGATNRVEIDPAVGPPPALVTLSVNRAVFSVGETLAVTLRADNPGLPATVDFFSGAILPDGDPVVFFTGAGGLAFGRLSDLATARPVATGISLAAPFTVTLDDFVTHTWTGSEPTGTYELFLAALRPGALADGRADPGEIVALSTVPVTFDP